jgi:hypothetical protein
VCVLVQVKNPTATHPDNEIYELRTLPGAYVHDNTRPFTIHTGSEPDAVDLVISKIFMDVNTGEMFVQSRDKKHKLRISVSATGVILLEKGRAFFFLEHMDQAEFVGSPETFSSVPVSADIPPEMGTLVARQIFSTGTLSCIQGPSPAHDLQYVWVSNAKRNVRFNSAGDLVRSNVVGLEIKAFGSPTVERFETDQSYPAVDLEALRKKVDYFQRKFLDEAKEARKNRSEVASSSPPRSRKNRSSGREEEEEVDDIESPPRKKMMTLNDKVKIAKNIHDNHIDYVLDASADSVTLMKAARAVKLAVEQHSTDPVERAELFDQIMLSFVVDKELHFKLGFIAQNQGLVGGLSAMARLPLEQQFQMYQTAYFPNANIKIAFESSEKMQQSIIDLARTKSSVVTMETLLNSVHEVIGLVPSHWEKFIPSLCRVYEFFMTRGDKQAAAGYPVIIDLLTEAKSRFMNDVLAHQRPVGLSDDEYHSQLLLRAHQLAFIELEKYEERARAIDSSICRINAVLFSPSGSGHYSSATASHSSGAIMGAVGSGRPGSSAADSMPRCTVAGCKFNLRHNTEDHAAGCGECGRLHPTDKHVDADVWKKMTPAQRNEWRKASRSTTAHTNSSKSPTSGGGSGSKSPKKKVFTGTCNRCRAPGHMIRDCPCCSVCLSVVHAPGETCPKGGAVATVTPQIAVGSAAAPSAAEFVAQLHAYFMNAAQNSGR